MNGYEIQILDFIQEHLTADFLDPIMRLITLFGDGGVFWIAVCLVMLLLPKTRRLGCAMALSLIVEALLCNLLLKPLVARIRPFDVNTAIALIVKAPKDYSFPSGHTGASFAVVGALLFQKSRLWIPACVLSVLIGFSRLYLYVHYPTDVLGGILLGMFTGWLAALMLSAFEKRKLKRQEDPEHE